MKDLIWVLIAGLFSALIFYMFLQPIPIVKYSVSTSRCVCIEIEGECHDCSILKDLKKFNTEFVK